MKGFKFTPGMWFVNARNIKQLYKDKHNIVLS